MPLATAIVKSYPEADATKLTAIEEGAQVNPADLAALDLPASDKLAGIEDEATVDQTGEEIRDAVVALTDEDRKLVITRPETGEHKIFAVKRAADEFQYDYEDVPEA
ncbi:hypothetical protein ES708_04725 [subsurface metagenome]